MKRLSPNDAELLLARFGGFHDASYQQFALIPQANSTGKFNCRISLLAQEAESGLTRAVVLQTDGVHEFQIRYNDVYDYPNVRDDVAIETFAGLVYVDLGSASTRPQSPEDVTRSDVYFVGEAISFEESPAEAAPRIGE